VRTAQWTLCTSVTQNFVQAESRKTIISAYLLTRQPTRSRREIKYSLTRLSAGPLRRNNTYCTNCHRFPLLHHDDGLLASPKHWCSNSINWRKIVYQVGFITHVCTHVLAYLCLCLFRSLNPLRDAHFTVLKHKICDWSWGGLSRCLYDEQNYMVFITVQHNFVQGVHKRMVQLQKLTRNLFLTFRGHNIYRPQRQLSKFLMRYQQF
jgi:hypothetical protein